ncbi:MULTISPECIES: hypothetical protein [Sphingobacterium]|uniref:HEAT repeat domain-containing protein n=1 Tax=Sphingobacterium athyrii TaxID=2152717 RepID=A0A363NK57_9SPHI|nr:MULTISPECIES: hypothetical protein [Sphingobacterium]PUV21080.1 hypothetical protein DCO56_28875 [Sphingobacterium athyrii]QIH34414.1 hypothetical protein G6053_16645 [Sphingobacterium sp. DR205]
MVDIEILEKRWAELASKPKTKEEIEETLLLAKQIELERAKEYQGLIDELAVLDIKINSIWDLVNTKSKYPKAIPILMKYLPLVNYVRNKEGIVRALTVPEAKGIVVPLLIREYLQLSNDKENLKWVIGNAVNVTITKSEVANIFPIVLNKENGLSRQMFVSALGKIKAENVKDVLLRLVNDDDKVISDEAKKSLKKVS